MNFKKGLSMMFSCFITFSAMGNVRAMNGDSNNQQNDSSWWNSPYVQATITLLSLASLGHTLYNSPCGERAYNWVVDHCKKNQTDEMNNEQDKRDENQPLKDKND